MAYISPMFGEENQKHQYGPDLVLSERLNGLRELEHYFFNACVKKRIQPSFDLTGEEPPYFQTLNYTNYAGLFIAHPLQTELSIRQMYDAFREGSHLEMKREFRGFLMNAISGKVANKYNTERSPTSRFRKAVVVLPGSNRLKTHVCLNKIRWIYKRHGEDVVFKPHPITHEHTLSEFAHRANLPISAFSGKDEDLYEIIAHAGYVYTTHISESAAYAAILGKHVSPIDPVQTRFYSSFAHINYFFFSEPNSDEWVDQMFSSPKSGVFHPEVDSNWKEKIDEYLDYILDLRDRYKNAYTFEAQA